MSFERHRDKDGTISRKHGNTLISTQRGIYGRSFAPDCHQTDMLSDVLAKLDDPSLAHLVHDEEAARLHEKLVRR